MSNEPTSRHSQRAKVQAAIKELARLQFAYRPCDNYEGVKGCDVCSARYAPLQGIKSVLKLLRAK